MATRNHLRHIAPITAVLFLFTASFAAEQPARKKVTLPPASSKSKEPAAPAEKPPAAKKTNDGPAKPAATKPEPAATPTAATPSPDPANAAAPVPTADPATGNTDAAPLEPEIPPEPVIPQPAPDPSDVPRKFDDGRVPFSVRFHGVDVAYETIAAFVMPGEVFELEAKRGSGDFDANADEGPVIATGKSAWRWTAPAKPGEYEIGLRDKEGKWLSDEITIRMFVMTPYDGGPAIGDYSIGTYEKKPHRDDPVYLAPKGFVEVNDRNDDTEISPHFTLGQFRNLAKGREYIALKTSLVVKLERLLEELARRGMPAKTLQVVSGFRTPAYNANIGNESKWSRHLYGDAADVVLDRDEDGFQDDMDGDSLSTVEDARKLLEVVEHIEKRPDPPALGGLAPYRANPQHGPFLHVDTRGKPARW